MLNTIMSLFTVSDNYAHCDYKGLVELYRYLDEEAIAANELFSDAHINWDNFLVEDEFEEPRSYIAKCNSIKHDVYELSLHEYWEHREVDFVPHFSAFGGRYTDAEIAKMVQKAEERDKKANSPIFIIGSSEGNFMLNFEQKPEELFAEIEDLLAF